MADSLLILRVRAACERLRPRPLASVNRRVGREHELNTSSLSPGYDPTCPPSPVASVAVDTTGDGRTDALIADSDGDGRGDCLVLDTSGDGIPDTAVVGVLVDTDGDGQANVLLVDTTDDGNADTLVHIHGTDSWQRAPSGQHTFCAGPRSPDDLGAASLLLGAAGHPTGGPGRGASWAAFGVPKDALGVIVGAFCVSSGGLERTSRKPSFLLTAFC